jgi:putative membrane protein
MRNTTKRTATVAASATLCLVVAGAVAPGAMAAEKVDGDVAISNTETVSVLMGADGSIDAKRVYDQLVLSGKGKVDVSNPVSTKGLRNLDGFGGWTVRDGAQRIDTTVDGEQKYRSVSDFDGKLPVSIDVTYTLDGKRVQPGDVVGKSGTLEVRYEVRNITGKQQEVTYTDGEGNQQTKTASVVIPLVGSMTTVLPSTFTEVTPDGANAAGDGKGGTQLSFTMTLFPPIGSDRATFGYTAKIKDGVVPKASLSLLPVNPLENVSFKGGAASYKGGADAGADLTAGAVTIDSNLLKIRDGASDLVDGLFQLRDGAQQLNAGLAGKAAPGSKELAAGAKQLEEGLSGKAAPGSRELAAGAVKLAVGLVNRAAPGAAALAVGAVQLQQGAATLAAGANDLSAGAKQLDDGAGQLSAGAGQLSQGVSDANDGAGKVADGAGKVAGGASALSDGATKVDAGAAQLSGGLKDAKAGTPQLQAGAKNIADGLAKVDAGLGTLNDQIGGGLANINTGASDLVAALENQLIPGLTGAENALAGAQQLIASLDDALPQKAQLKAAVDGAKGAVEQVKGGLSTKVLAGAKATRDGSAQLKAGLNDQLDAGAGDGKIRNGVKALSAGVTGQLIPGIDKLAGGIDKLSTGADGLAAGTGTLSAGASDLSKGASDLKNGSGALATGTKALKDGAALLASKTGELKAGTSKVAAGAGQVAGGAGLLAGGTKTLAGGAGDLSKGIGDAADGSEQLAGGARTLSKGIGDAADGSGKIADGAGTLADGLGDAADGSGKLADGLETAAEKAPALPEGAQELSDKGTSQLVNVGNGTAMDYGLKYALIEAGSARAASVQPYGAPEGATELTAYKFDLAGATGEGSANVERGIAVAILAAAGLGLAAFRRRGIAG